MAISNIHNFSTHYVKLCKQQHVQPLPLTSINLSQNLDFTIDGLKINDWGPILDSLSLDRSLKSICVRSQWHRQWQKPPIDVNAGRKRTFQNDKVKPIVLTRYLLEWLSHSIGQCVRNSSKLTYLELEGIPLPTDCLRVLCVGLSETKTLKHLSLRGCYIGDTNCAIICHTIADVPCISTLNLSQCDLSSDSGQTLASALYRQKLLLYHDIWKNSLRYREPNLGVMPGLRRLTLNENPHLGDSAVAQIIDAIQDSLWLKALDLQNCGLTDDIGNKIIELLDNNKTLQVFDVRFNSGFNNEIVMSIFERLKMNNRGSPVTYELTDLPRKDSKISRKSKRPCQNNKNKLLQSKSMQILGSNTNNSGLHHHSNGIKPNIRTSCPSFRDVTCKKLRLFNCHSAYKAKNKIAKEKPKKIKIFIDLQTQLDAVHDFWKDDDNFQDDEENNTNTNRNIIDNNNTDKNDMNKNNIYKYIYNIDNNQCNNNNNNEATHNTRQMQDEQEIDKLKLIHKLEDLTKQLSDANKEKYELLKTNMKIKIQLALERRRRQLVQVNISNMKKDMKVLENTLKTTKLQTQRLQRTSKQSYEKIIASFAMLLKEIAKYDGKFINHKNKKLKKYMKLLSLSKFKDDKIKNKNDKKQDKVEKELKSVIAEENRHKINETDMKRRENRLLQKDKSEKFLRTSGSIFNSSKSLRLKKSTISQSKIHTYENYKNLIEFLKIKKADGPDLPMIPSTLSNYQNCKSYSPSERARVIFAEIVNSNIPLHFAS